MSRGRRSARPRADWTYRSNIHDAAGALVDSLGSYEAIATTLAPGVGSAIFKCLYDSHNRVGGVRKPDAAGATFFPSMPGPARAEGGKAKILAVQGTLQVTPVTWALGNRYTLGIRFGQFEMDPISPAILIDPLYTMLGVGTLIQSKPAQWANDRNWDREFRHTEVFNDNSQTRMFRFSFRVRRTLRPNMAYGMFLETSNGSVNVAITPWFRALVSDEG